jgi:TolB protein
MAKVPEPSKISKIAFVRNFRPYYGFDVCTMNLDGTNTQRITKDSSNDLNPSLSPNGTKIIFESTREWFNLPSIYIIDANGKNAKCLTQEGEFCQRPEWSPDGTKIAYCVMKNASGASQGASSQAFDPDGIFVMDSDGGNKREAVKGWSPSWLDNNRLVYITGQSGTWQTYSIDIKSHIVDKYGNCNVRFQIGQLPKITVSPDGNSVAFDQLNRPNKRDICILSLNTNEIKTLTAQLKNNCYYPTWSPDGTQIAFTMETGERWDSEIGETVMGTAIYTIGINGGEPTLLIENGAYPSWQREEMW